MTEVESIELSIQAAKRDKELRDAVVRLQKNPDFKKVIVEGYFQKEALRLLELSANSRLGADVREDALAEAKATVRLKSYLETIIHLGNYAESTDAEREEALLDARREETL